MKKNIKLIILAVVLWIPLSYVIFIHSEEEMVMRIIMSIGSGPILFFYSSLCALAVSALSLGSNYILGKLGFAKGIDDKYMEMFSYSFNGSFGVIFVVMYYFTITNQHLFYRVYGGW